MSSWQLTGLDMVARPQHFPASHPASGAFVACPTPGIAAGMPMLGPVADLYRLAYETAATQAARSRFVRLTRVSPN